MRAGMHMHGSQNANADVGSTIRASRATTTIDGLHVDEETCSQSGREKEKAKVYGTRYSQAVTHPSTNRARRCLTSVIGREPVLST
jgi:hypothetical protein